MGPAKTDGVYSRMVTRGLNVRINQRVYVPWVKDGNAVAGSQDESVRGLRMEILGMKFGVTIQIT